MEFNVETVKSCVEMSEKLFKNIDTAVKFCISLHNEGYVFSFIGDVLVITDGKTITGWKSVTFESTEKGDKFALLHSNSKDSDPLRIPCHEKVKARQKETKRKNQRPEVDTNYTSDDEDSTNFGFDMGEISMSGSIGPVPGPSNFRSF